MGDVTIGLLHPGRWARRSGSAWPGPGTRCCGSRRGAARRPGNAPPRPGWTGAGWAEMAARSDVIVSVCPPACGAGRGPGGGRDRVRRPLPGRQRDLAGHRGRGGRDRGGRRCQLRGRRDHRHSPGGAGFIRLYLSGAARRGGPGAVRRHRGRRAAGRAAGHGVRGEDGVRVLDQGIGRAAAGGAGAGPGRGRGVRPARGVGHLPARPGDSARTARTGRRRPRAGAGWARWKRSPRPWPRPGCPRASTRPRPRSTAGIQQGPRRSDR